MAQTLENNRQSIDWGKWGGRMAIAAVAGTLGMGGGVLVGKGMSNQPVTVSTSGEAKDGCLTKKTENVRAQCYAMDGDLPKLKAMVADGFNLNVKDEDGCTVLPYAVAGDNRGTIEWILDQKVDPATELCFGRTPLQKAMDDGGERRENAVAIFNARGITK